MIKSLNIFYEEPDNDRWLPLDRHPRRFIRRIVRGQPPIGGMMRYFVNLCAGLDRIGISYSVNNYRYLKKHPSEIACVIGKPHVLEKIKWKNPIIFGPAVFSHPCEAPFLLEKLPVKKVLLSCEWFKNMYAQELGDSVMVWPSGIDTYKWQLTSDDNKDIDVLIYDKVRWNYTHYEQELIEPIKQLLSSRGLKTEVIRYGFYREEDFQNLLTRAKAMIFLCEHETQGFAYLQTLSSGVPILAWDRGGFWQDPSYYPHKVQFQSVSSVPYWDERCGVKFKDFNDFPVKLEEFIEKLNSQQFTPRDYILANLTLEKCAENYVNIVTKVQAELV